MKRKNAILILIILVLGLQGMAQVTKEDFDRSVQAQTKVNEQTKSQVDELKNIIGKPKPTDAAIADRLAKVEEAKIKGGRPLGTYELILVFFPLILFLFFFITCIYGMNFRSWIRDSVTDPDKPIMTVTKATTLATIKRQTGGVETLTEEPQSTEVKTDITSYGKSASRMVMFFSSFLSVILALSFATVFIYGYLRGNEVPDFTSLVKVLLSLGIGVIPYTINQFTKPDNNNPSTKP